MTDDNVEQRVLPEFEGETVRAVVLAFGGKQADSANLGTVLHRGDKVIVLVEGTVTDIAFAETKSILQRIQKVVVSDAHLLTDTIDGVDLLQKMRAERSTQLDELLGTPSLDTAMDDADPEPEAGAPDPNDELDPDDPRLDGEA